MLVEGSQLGGRSQSYRYRNVASQAIPQIRDLAVSNAVPAASSVCALRLLTKLFGNGGAFASPSMLVLGSDDFSSSMFIPDISSAFTSVDSNNNSLASLRVAITSGEQIQGLRSIQI